MMSGLLVFQSLRRSRTVSLPVHRGGVGCSVRLCRSFLSISRGLYRRSIRASPVLKRLLFVLLQGAVDGILDQPLADPQQLCLVWLRPAAPTWVEKVQECEHIKVIVTHDYSRGGFNNLLLCNETTLSDLL